MTPLTSSETLYETALKYIGASPDGKSIESRKCRLLGNIGPDGEGFGPAFRTAVGLDADSSTPEFSRTVQAWAMWGQFVETGKGRQGDTVVTEDFVGIVDSIGEHEIRAIGFQNGAVRIAKVSRPKSMIRRAFLSQPEETIKFVAQGTHSAASILNQVADAITPPTVPSVTLSTQEEVDGLSVEFNEVIKGTDVEAYFEARASDTTTVTPLNPGLGNIDAMKEAMERENMQATLKKDGTPKGKPGRKPKLQ